MIDCELALARCIVLDNHLHHRYLIFGSLGQRYTYRVTNAVREQSTYAHSTLYSAFDAIARLGYAQVYRVGHVLLLHSLNQQPVGMYHDTGVARFHRNNNLVEIFFAAYSQKLHRRYDHSLGSVAPFVEYAFGE